MTTGRSPQIGGQQQDLSPSLAREWHAIRTTHVWLVDDSDDITDMVRFFFERYCGFNVTLFRTSQALEETLTELTPTQIPTLIMVDDYIPTMQGFDVLSTLLKKQPLLEQTPVILFTVISHQRYHEQARELGFSQILMKPFDLNNLASVAQHYTGERYQRSLE